MWSTSNMSCGHCGGYHTGSCPRVKAIEYYANGTVKRVEYHDTITGISSAVVVPSCWPADGEGDERNELK